MHHFFVTPNQVSGDEIYIEGSDVNHICNVLRMKKEKNFKSVTGIIKNMFVRLMK